MCCVCFVCFVSLLFMQTVHRQKHQNQWEGGGGVVKFHQTTVFTITWGGAWTELCVCVCVLILQHIGYQHAHSSSTVRTCLQMRTFLLVLTTSKDWGFRLDFQVEIKIKIKIKLRVREAFGSGRVREMSDAVCLRRSHKDTNTWMCVCTSVFFLPFPYLLCILC